MSDERHPRDSFITVYGRKPVLEALRDRQLPVDKVFIAHNARGGIIHQIEEAAAARRLRPERVRPETVNRFSRNARQDQGVVADVRAPQMDALGRWLQRLPRPAQDRKNGEFRWLLAVDHVTNPANIGLLLRSMVAAGFDGLVLPRQGCPDIGPLVIKASAGLAFRAPILRCAALPDALVSLKRAGFSLLGLDGEAPRSLYDWDGTPPDRAVFVLGSESEGLSGAVRAELDGLRAIPLANEVESLNVAVAASLVCFEVRRAALSALMG